MNHTDFRTYKSLLRHLRSYLRDDVNILLDTALDMVHDDMLHNPPGICRACRTHWRTSLAQVLRKYFEGLVAHKEAVLYHIDHALERIQDGSYGTCERCEAEIPPKRLVSAPYVSICGTCDSPSSAALSG